MEKKTKTATTKNCVALLTSELILFVLHCKDISLVILKILLLWRNFHFEKKVNSIQKEANLTIPLVSFKFLFLQFEQIWILLLLNDFLFITVIKCEFLFSEREGERERKK